MTFEALMEAYDLHLKGLRRTASTRRNAFASTRDFARHCQSQGVLTPDRMEMAHFTSWVGTLKGRYAPMTLYSRQRMVRTWLRWAALRGHLLMDPLKRYTPPKHPQILGRGAPSEADVRAMLEAPTTDDPMGPRDRAIFEFLYGTGVRSAECVNVELEHLNLEACSLRIVNGKGGYHREIPFGDHLCGVLSHYLAEVRPKLRPKTTRLWVKYGGGPATGAVVMYTLKKWRKLCNLANFSAHSFRHAYATHMLRRGAPLVALQRLLGHHTLCMTSRYTHLVPADLQDELLRTHPRGKRKRRGRAPKAEE